MLPLYSKKSMENLKNKSKALENNKKYQKSMLPNDIYDSIH
jgi:hypothetical protein